MKHSTYAPDTITATPTWHKRAACLEADDPDVMFPDNKDGRIAYAKSFCQRCPVIRECLLDAMRVEGKASRETRWGIRGGLNPTERTALYRKNPKRWNALRERG